RRYCSPSCSLFPYTTLFRSSKTAAVLVDAVNRASVVRAAEVSRSVKGAVGRLNGWTRGRVTFVALSGEFVENFVAGTVAVDSEKDRKSTRLNSSHSQISYAV